MTSNRKKIDFESVLNLQEEFPAGASYRGRRWVGAVKAASQRWRTCSTDVFPVLQGSCRPAAGLRVQATDT